MANSMDPAKPSDIKKQFSFQFVPPDMKAPIFGSSPAVTAENDSVQTFSFPKQDHSMPAHFHHQAAPETKPKADGDDKRTTAGLTGEARYVPLFDGGKQSRVWSPKSEHDTETDPSSASNSDTYEDTREMRGRDRSSMMQYINTPCTTAGIVVSDSRLREIQAAPIFSAKVQDALETDKNIAAELSKAHIMLFPQYSMLGSKVGVFRDGSWKQPSDLTSPDNLLFLNTNEPLSAFICGSQGAGKSHTLSCMLEGALLRKNPVGEVKQQSAAIVFHYDQFSGYATSQVCESAYLASKGIPVRVIVSPTNYQLMKCVYGDLKGLPKGTPKPQVIPFFLKEENLRIDSVKTLMSCAEDTTTLPLYLERIFSILKDMTMEAGSSRARLNYRDFKQRLKSEDFSKDQKGPLTQRLALLDEFMTRHQRLGISAKQLNKVWDFEPGSLTIVDLSCPFVSVGDACSMFSMALSLFMEGRGNGVPKVIALDEAHKFLGETSEAAAFTDGLVSIIAQQRHLGARVIIITQEPTLSPRLLELSNISIVHHFKSPKWFATLKKHLAGELNESGIDLFREIVGLRTGEAMVFAPTAVIDMRDKDGDGNKTSLDLVQPQGTEVFKMMVRKRVTVDGGRSIQAVGH